MATDDGVIAASGTCFFPILRGLRQEGDLELAAAR
jgi:hypothetical protein